MNNEAKKISTNPNVQKAYKAYLRVCAKSELAWDEGGYQTTSRMNAQMTLANKRIGKAIRNAASVNGIALTMQDRINIRAALMASN